MLMSELAKTKTKENAVQDIKFDVDHKHTKIMSLKRELDDERIKMKHMKENYHLLKHDNQMIDTKKNQLCRSNLLL